MSVDLTVEGAVAKVVLNRPEKLNALSGEMRESLCDHFARLRYDDAVRVVVVTGAGSGFCSGADVDRMAGQHHDLRGGRQRLQQGGHTFIRALHAIEKPIIAAVRGPAVGIGWSIALACDLVVASKTARFSQIFRRIGLGPRRRRHLVSDPPARHGQGQGAGVLRALCRSRGGAGAGSRQPCRRGRPADGQDRGARGRPRRGADLCARAWRKSCFTPQSARASTNISTSRAWCSRSCT